MQDGHYVQEGTILVKQRNLRFHPGLYVSVIMVFKMYIHEEKSNFKK